MSAFVAGETIVKISEIDCHGYASDSATGLFETREDLWVNFDENRDEQSNDWTVDRFSADSDEKREGTSTDLSVSTPRANGTLLQAPMTYPKKTVLQKWESIIRANHGVENFGKITHFDETKSPSSQLHNSRPVGVLTSDSNKSTKTRNRRSFGLSDVTNNLNTPSPVSNFVRSDCAVAKSQTDAKEAIKSRLSFGSSNFTQPSTFTKSKDHTSNNNKFQPARERRSFGLSDFVEGLDTPSANRPDRNDTFFGETRNATNLRSQSDSLVSKVTKIVSSTEQDKKLEKLVGMQNDRVIEENEISKRAGKSNSMKHTTSRHFPLQSVDNMKFTSLACSDNYQEKSKTKFKKTPVRALVILEHPKMCDVVAGEAIQCNRDEGILMIKNLNTKIDGAECECLSSVFSGKDDLISFFLPQMGMACGCGRKRNRLVNPDDPTSLENILRPWQVEFLKSIGIYQGEEFVKAVHRSGGITARAMRQWRKKRGMNSFKTSACATALQIWSKICKAHVRSIRRQALAGNENLECMPLDEALFREMSQFLEGLPAAPKRRDHFADGFDDFEPGSQVEV